MVFRKPMDMDTSLTPSHEQTKIEPAYNNEGENLMLTPLNRLQVNAFLDQLPQRA